MKRLAFDDLLQAILPWECPACSERCHASEFCSCGKLMRPANPANHWITIGSLGSGPDRIMPVQSLWEFTDEARQFFHRVKYFGEDQWLGRWLRSRIEVDGLKTITNATRILPVPSRRRAWLRRGFNPAEEIARLVARETGLQMAGDLLSRRAFVGPQVGRTREDRISAIRGQFIAAQSDYEGASILLIDDVMTTGATLGECARILFAKGVKQVSAWTLFRA